MNLNRAERIRVGVVGCNIGRSHVAAYQSLPQAFEVVVVCDIDEAKARAAAAEQHVLRITTDIAEVCRMDDVDVVDICTPSYLHYAQSLSSLAAAKPVV